MLNQELRRDDDSALISFHRRFRLVDDLLTTPHEVTLCGGSPRRRCVVSASPLTKPKKENSKIGAHAKPFHQFATDHCAGGRCSSHARNRTRPPEGCARAAARRRDGSG